MISQLKKIYSMPYIGLNIAFAAMYYLLITGIIAMQENGSVAIYTPVPVYLLYLLAISSSVTLTFAVYSISNTRKNAASVSATATSSILAVSGGVISGCACQASVLSAVLALLVNSGQALYLSTIVQAYAPYVFISMIAVNVLVAIYYLNKFSSPRCTINQRRGKAS